MKTEEENKRSQESEKSQARSRGRANVVKVVSQR